MTAGRAVQGVLTAGMAVFAALVSPSVSAQDAGRLKVINCYDADRNLVRRIPLWRCEGEVVSDARAKEIRESRVRRTKRRMAPVERLYAGLRMQSSGTGFFVSRQGHLLTNNHVVANCTALSVKPTEERAHERATLIGRSERDDLAVVLFPGGAPAVAEFRRPLRLRKGNPIAVIGHPLHGMVAIKPVFVTGSVRSMNDPKLVRWGRFAINADVRRGNSGGPVIDDGGYVVGVVSAKVNTPEIYKKTGTVLRDVGVAVRQERALNFLREHKIRYLVGNDRNRLDHDALEARGASIVARIGCWR